MDDRWLFVASLVVFGIFATFVMKYFVRQHEWLIEDHKEARDSYQESLRDVVAEQSAANAKLIVCLENNTKVLEECRDELRLVRMALGGLYHGYRQLRNRKVNEALVQGVETARAVLTTTPQGQAMDAQFVRWLMEHQKEAGVFATVSGLVDRLSDNPAAKLTAQEIMERCQKSVAA